MLEINYLRFLSRAVVSPGVFRRLWRQAVDRLYALKNSQALEFARSAPLEVEKLPAVVMAEEQILALGSGDVAVFPGKQSGKADLLIASPYVPFPLSHGGAVRIYNLMRHTAGDYNQVLVAFCEKLETPPRELVDICAEIVLVRRTGSHSLPSTSRPEVVEEFDSTAFHAVLRQIVRKWRPRIAQLEFTQMALYAADCAPAKTILVEHDITFDLYQQLADDWEARRQLERWRGYETAAWRRVDCVVTMSEKDRRVVTGARAAVIPNGVDVERFQPSGEDPERARLLFIGSFAHRPNVMAMEFFLSEVWPLIQGAAPALHIIAGTGHERFPIPVKPGVEVEGFVSDVRPAYRRAALVVAPLVASAGTNVKILEAMSMGKAVVSTPAGVNGLDLIPGKDVCLATSAADMAEAILELLRDPAQRRELERHARQTALRDYDWNRIARLQRQLYRSV
jgi:glycosyltransferase involved in cell wall biosynthesis